MSISAKDKGKDMRNGLNRRIVVRTSKPDAIGNCIEQMGTSMSFLVMGILEAKTDEFEKRFRKLNNFYDYVQAEKAKWNVREDTEELIRIAKEDNPHIWESCEAVPFSQLLYLAQVGKKGNRTKDPNLKSYLQCGYCVIGVWFDKVLKEHYRFSLEKRKELFRLLNYWIDSYQKGYQSDEGIRTLYIEELGYDLTKGEFVDA